MEMKESKVPLRIIRKESKQINKKCFCYQLCELINGKTQTLKETPTPPVKKNKSTHIQTDPLKNNVETQSFEKSEDESKPTTKKDSLTEIFKILQNIDNNIESILTNLQDKKEQLYMHGLFENYAFNPDVCHQRRQKRSKHNRIKQKNSEIDNTPLKTCLPSNSVSLLCLPRTFMEQSLGINYPIILPKTYSFFYNYKPLSCPDINYFQMLGKMVDPKGSAQIYSDSQVPTRRTLEDDCINFDCDDAK